MDIVISWSGPQSRSIASAVYKWLPEVIPGLSLWMSDEDISKGKIWFTELMTQLGKSKACIICVTPENVEAPWIYFEFGAVASKVDDAYVFPFLVGADPSDLEKTPLAQYQCTKAEKEDTWRLIKGINAALGDKIHHEQLLKKAFEAEWSSFEARLAAQDKGQTIQPNRIGNGVPHLTFSPTLEEVEILSKAAASDGCVFVENFEFGFCVHVKDEQLNEGGEGRAARRWEEAVEHLTDLGLLKREGFDGDIYKLTSKGYEGADQIKLLTGPTQKETDLREVEKMMPDLFVEMREDYKKNPLIRELILLNTKGNIYNGGGVLSYYRETHPDLDSKMQILENHNLITETTFNNTKRYRVSEVLVDYLLKGQAKKDS